MARDIVEEILRRPDPEGYYLIPVHGKHCIEMISSLVNDSVVIENVGDTILVRVKSRSLAKKLLRKLTDNSRCEITV